MNLFKALFISALVLSQVLILSAQDITSVVSLERRLAASLKKDTTRVDILIELYDHYNLVHNQGLSSKYIEEAHQIVKELNDPNRLFLVLQRLSYMAFQSQKLSQCLVILKELLDLARKHQMLHREYRVLINMGHTYGSMGAESKAEECYSEAYNVSKKTNNADDIIYAIDNLASLQSSIGNHKGAIEKLLYAIEYKEKVTRKVLVEETYLYLANAYAGLNELDKAKAAFDSCQATISRHKLPELSQCRLYHELSKFYLDKLNEPKMAIVLLHKILSPPSPSIPQGGIVEWYNTLASAYLADHNPVEALRYAQISKAMSDTLGDVDLAVIRKAYQRLALSKAGLNEWKDAYDYRTMADNLADSLSRKREKELATFAIVGREIESNERELVEKKNRAEQQKRLYQVIGIASIPVLLILAALFYYRNKLSRSKERIGLQKTYTETLEQKIEERTQELEQAHKQIQEAKERENVSLALLNQRHLSLLDELAEKLGTWEDNSTVNIAKDIRPTLHDIQAAQRQAEEWGTFMLHFERIHPDFTQKLQKTSSSLSNNELKHCAFMKMGMSRKEVADTLKCSEEAVKQSRNRIRKKLGLAPDDFLQDFINNL